MSAATIARSEAERARLRALVRELALHVRAAVIRHVGAHAARAHHDDVGAGGDVTFNIDALAEAALADFVAREGAGAAFFSEARGLVPRCR